MSPTRKPIKAYELYSTGVGWSAHTVAYSGRLAVVSATSLRQALYLVNNGVWIDPDKPRPTGIVYEYRRSAGAPGDHFLWCGCRVYGWPGIAHGKGITAIRHAIDQHECEPEEVEADDCTCDQTGAHCVACRIYADEGGIEHDDFA